LISEHDFSSNELNSDNNEVPLFPLMWYPFTEDVLLSVPRSAEDQATLTKMSLMNRNCHTTHQIP